MKNPNQYKVLDDVTQKQFAAGGFVRGDGYYRAEAYLYQKYVRLILMIDETDHYMVISVTKDSGDTYAPFYNPSLRFNNKIYDEVVSAYNQFMDGLVKKHILKHVKENSNVEEVVVNIKKLNKAAKTPLRGSNESAGYDLYANTKDIIEIQPHETVKVGTGIAMEIPDMYCGLVFARSGLATKEGLRPANCVGLIDQDYRGEIIVALHNDADVVRFISPNERIAQLVISPYLPVTFNEVDKLNTTSRGDGGFGSTGSK